MTTPVSVEKDVQDIFASILPADIIAAGAGRNAYPGLERPFPDTLMECAFFELTEHRVSDVTNDGNMRVFAIDIVLRGGKNAAAALQAKAGRVWDACSTNKGTLGPWVAPVSGVRYLDLTPKSMQQQGPGASDQLYWIVNVEAWFDG